MGVQKMKRVDNLKRNGSGCLDLTAYEAIKNVERRSKKLDMDLDEGHKLNILLRSIKILCDRSGYSMIGRITLKNKKTGKIYK